VRKSSAVGAVQPRAGGGGRTTFTVIPVKRVCRVLTTNGSVVKVPRTKKGESDRHHRGTSYSSEREVEGSGGQFGPNPHPKRERHFGWVKEKEDDGGLEEKRGFLGSIPPIQKKPVLQSGSHPPRKFDQSLRPGPRGY